ncbi:dihydrolipoamide acetyltransferase family protein [candidate division KSB1 bacterium]
MIFEFRLADIGEGLAESEIVKYLVKEGDTVKVDQPVVKIENDKALTELPSPVNGKIVKLTYSEGDMAATGSVIMTIETEEVPAEIGHGHEQADEKPAQEEVKTAASDEVKVAEFAHEPVTAEVEIPVPQKVKTGNGERVKAAPHTRKLARELGIDIETVTGSGKGGRITDDDVRNSQKAPSSAQSVTGTFDRTPEVVPFRGIRRRTAEKMVQSWQTIPHVSHTDEADITDIASHLEKIAAYPEFKVNKITLLSFMVRIVTNSLKEFPYFNSFLDEKNEQIHLLKNYNIGFAVDTESGLMVPVLKNADVYSVLDISDRLRNLADKARDRSIKPEELQGGTFTITNVGAIGGQMATPIILHPQVAILGMLRAKMKPVVFKGDIKPRLMLPLVITFDHRLIDGVAAAKFLDHVIKQLEDPLRLIMELK